LPEPPDIPDDWQRAGQEAFLRAYGAGDGVYDTMAPYYARWAQEAAEDRAGAERRAWVVARHPDGRGWAWAGDVKASA
jgi:hypothetical protein